jgi:hypothetical protein
MGNALSLNYEYETYERAPMEHRRVALYTFSGVSVDVIASLLNLTPNTVRKIQTHKPIAAHIAFQLDGRAAGLAESKATMDKLLSRSVQVLEHILEDDLTPTAVRLKAVETIMDRHYAGEFVKRSKHEKVEHRVHDAGKLEELRKKGALLDIGEEAVEAEFTVGGGNLSGHGDGAEASGSSYPLLEAGGEGGQPSDSEPEGHSGAEGRGAEGGEEKG